MTARHATALRLPVGPPAVGIAGILLALLLLAAPLYASVIFGSNVIHEFESLFRGFGAKLPLMTRIVLAHAAQVGWVLQGLTLAQLILLAMMVLQRTRTSRRRYLWIALPCFLIAFALLAMLYAPAIHLGAVV